MAEEKMIAYCGITCHACPAYVGTQAGDKELLEKTAAEWSFGEEKLTVGDMECYSCLQTEKPLFKWCALCKVKECCREKDLPNCAHCDEYACEDLKKLWDMFRSDDARMMLDDIRRDIKRL
jgi:hypothetical protein